MKSFTRKLLLHNISFQLHFDKIKTTTGIKYFVYARDEYCHTHSFNMEPEGSSWRIINAPRVNDLLLNSEKKLSDMINEHLKKSI